jgi:hypothetical protein
MIKSIVIPHPNGVNLKTLCEEYEEFEGNWHLNKWFDYWLIYYYY